MRYEDVIAEKYHLAALAAHLEHQTADPRERQMYSGLRHCLVQAEPFVWADEIRLACMAASESLPDSWVLTREAIPARFAFWWFDGDHSLPVLAWSAWREIPGVKFREALAMPDEVGRTLTGIQVWVSTPDILHRAAWSFGETLGEHLQLALSQQPLNAPSWVADQIRAVQIGTRFLAAGLAWLGTVLTRDTVLIERAARRRLQRTYPEEPGTLQVVKLRRVRHSSAPATTGEPVAWNWQWLVRGHWRDQWYPSLASHQPIWISPYVKGPDDKPLKEPRQNVFAVIR